MKTRRNPAMLFITLLTLLSLHNSCGFPDGAPNKHSVCKHLLPHHKHARPQESPSPYVIVGKKKIPCGTAVNITISAQPDHSYKGFIMQARSDSGHNKPLGTFTITDPVHSKTIACHGLDNNTVTHSSPVLKTSTSFVWTPPPKYKGNIIFKATVVKEFSTFWANVTETVEMSCSEGSNYADLKGEEEEEEEEEAENVNSLEEEYDETEPSHWSIYGECGVTKVCVGLPDDCVATRSCEAMVTVTSRQSKYEFEMLGVPYVGVGFSENDDLNTDSLMECVLVNDVDVKLYQTRYEFSSAYYLRQPPSKDLELVNSSYWDGMVYCKFVRNDEVEINGVHFNFRTKKYYILLLSTNGTAEQRQNKTRNSVIVHSSRQNDYLRNVTGFSPPTQLKHVVPKRNKVIQFMRDFLFGNFAFIFTFML